MYPRKFANNRHSRAYSRPLVESLEYRTMLSTDAAPEIQAAQQAAPLARGTIVGGDAISFGNGTLNATASMQVSASLYGAVGDGIADDAAAIQRALNEAPIGSIVTLDPTKTYRISSTLVISRSVSLDGNGATLYLNPSAAGTTTFIDIRSQAGTETYGWSETVSAGQASFRANIPTSQIRNGDWILIALGEDPGNPGQAQYERLVRVVSNDGTTLVINRPVPFAVSAGALGNTIRKAVSAVKAIAVRNLVFDYATGVAPSSAIQAYGVNSLAISNVSGRLAGFDLTACTDVRIQGVNGQLGGRLAAVSLLKTQRCQDIEIRGGSATWEFNRPAISVEGWSRDVRVVDMSLTCVMSPAPLDSVFTIGEGSSQIQIDRVYVRTYSPANLVRAEDARGVSIHDITLVGWYSNIPAARAASLTVNGVVYRNGTGPMFPVNPGPAPTGTPGGLRIAARDREHITLAWDQTTQNQAWFEIERSSDGTNFTALAKVEGECGEYTDGDVRPGITYYYRVRGANYAGESPFSVAVPAVARDGLNVEFGAAGIRKITFGDYSLLDLSVNSGDGFRVGNYRFRKPDGTEVSSWGGSNYTAQFDLSTKTMTWRYSWGAVSCQYVAENDNLRIITRVVNNHPTDTLVGISVIPFIIQFPQFPDGFRPTWPYMGLGLDGPTVIGATYATDAIVFTNEQIGRPLYSGFYSTPETASTRRWQVWVGSLRETMFPPNWAPIDRTVASGASDEYVVSLRCGDKATPIEQAAGDILQEYRNASPPELQWENRNPIGTLHVASSAAIHKSATNPRGWLHNSNIDVTTESGLEQFRTMFLSYADTAIAQLKSTNSQGMIVWDIEGLEHYSTAGYYGAPESAITLAPELGYRGLIDEFFARFRNAGLRVGVTLRALELVSVDGVIVQSAPADAFTTLLRKAQYAYQRWGATLFYIDTPRDFVTRELLPSSVFSALYRAMPDCLFIPEYGDTGYYASTALYSELRLGVTSTPTLALAYNPGAFSIINISDADASAARDLLVASVRRGDILMFNAWYDNVSVVATREIYAEARQ